MKAKANRVSIRIVKSDILMVRADALVHVTDPTLSMPEWLASATGPEVVSETRLIGFCDIGAVVATSAGRLPYKRILHTASPRWGEPSARGRLANATWAILQIAEDAAFNSIVIPPIATGKSGYPVENCAKIMLEQIIDFSFEKLKSLREVIICAATEPELMAFESELERQIKILKQTDEGSSSPA